MGGVGLGLPRMGNQAVVEAAHTYAHYWDNCAGLISAQFQVGAELSEAITTENKSGKVRVPPNTGNAFLESYLRAIGAVNGNAKNVEFWGKDLDQKCKDHNGRKLLDTFLSKYFCLCYDGEKLLGDPDIETGVDTGGGKDIVLDLRFGDARDGSSLQSAEALSAVAGQEAVGIVPAARTIRGKRIMFLIEYHCQLHVKDNDVSRSF